MAKYTFKDFLRECKEALKELWIKIWGEDLPKDMTKLYPDEEYNLGEQIRYYEEDKKKLAKKRRTAIIVILILSLISFNVIKDKIKYFIENNPTIACWNKPVCMVDGPKMNYPSTYGITTKMDDGNYFIYKYEYGKKFLGFFGKYEYITESNKRKNVKIVLPVFELYNVKHNKLTKVILKVPFEHYYIKHVYPDYRLLIENHKKNRYIIYDIKNKNWKNVNPNFNNDFVFLSKYNDNKDLYITNYSNYNYNSVTLVDERREISNKESLYFYDYVTLQYEKLPDFAQKAKYLPEIQTDIRILKNGKIIFPIRKRKSILIQQYPPYSVYNSIWDHVEIYDPETNKFYAEKNPYVLDKNLFDIELNNGNILFVNQESSYIFNNKLNKFQELDQSEKRKISLITKKLLSFIGSRYIYNTNYSLEDYINFIHLPNNKFLIKCARSINLEQRYKLCTYSTVFDYDTLNLYQGPKFDFRVRKHGFEILNDDKVMIKNISSFFGKAAEYYPIEKLKIIRVKKGEKLNVILY